MIERLRSVPPGPEAMAIAGLSLTAAGLAVAADALAEAAVPRALGGFDRILFGLWRLQLAQMLTLTVGLGLLALGLHRGARLGDWREPVRASRRRHRHRGAAGRRRGGDRLDDRGARGTCGATSR